MDKSTRQILIEYMCSDSEDDWLLGELSDFFVDDAVDGDSDELRYEAGQAAIERACAGVDALIETRIEESTLVSFCISVICGDCGGAANVFFASVPSPEALLLYCTKAAKATDRIVVVYTFIDGLQLAFEGSWPFGMETAVELSTIPDLDEVAQGDNGDDARGTIVRAGRAGLQRIHDGVSRSFASLGFDDEQVRALGVGAAAVSLVAFALGRKKRH